MYCKKCGKFIGTDAELCDECAPKQAPVNDFTQQQTFNSYADMGYQTPVNVTPDTSEINLGRAIAAAILSFIGFIFVYAALFSIISHAATSFLLIIGLIPTIMGLVFGIKSISNFRQTSHIRSGKRIPVLILGIDSTATAGIGLFLAFIVFFVSLTIGAYI